MCHNDNLLILKSEYKNNRDVPIAKFWPIMIMIPQYFADTDTKNKIKKREKIEYLYECRASPGVVQEGV